MCVQTHVPTTSHDTHRETAESSNGERPGRHPFTPVSNRAPLIKDKSKILPHPQDQPLSSLGASHIFKCRATPQNVWPDGESSELSLSSGLDMTLATRSKAVVCSLGSVETEPQDKLLPWCGYCPFPGERGSQNFLRAETNPLLRFQSFCCHSHTVLEMLKWIWYSYL